MVKALVDAPPLEARPEAAADEDRALLNRYVETGSEDAFSQIVFRHTGWVFHYCRRNLRDAHLAEDAAQAVFLLLARKGPTLTPQTHLAGWLYQSCRYVLADIRKHRGRYRRREDVAREMSLRRQMDAETVVAVDSDRQVAVDEALSALRDSDRQAILMHFYEGLTLSEMSLQLGVTREGAKKRVSRALARLREKLGGRKVAFGLSIAGVVALLRTNAAQAAPADVARALARGVTVPGASSVTSELILQGVAEIAADATRRLLGRLAIMGAVAALTGGLALMVHRSGPGAGAVQAIETKAVAVPQVLASGGSGGGAAVVGLKPAEPQVTDATVWPAEPPYISQDDREPVKAVTKGGAGARAQAGSPTPGRAVASGGSGIVNWSSGGVRRSTPVGVPVTAAQEPVAVATPRADWIRPQVVLVDGASADAAPVATAVGNSRVIDSHGDGSDRPGNAGGGVVPHERTDAEAEHGWTPPRMPWNGTLVAVGPVPQEWFDPRVAPHVVIGVADGGRALLAVVDGGGHESSDEAESAHWRMQFGHGEGQGRGHYTTAAMPKIDAATLKALMDMQVDDDGDLDLTGDHGSLLGGHHGWDLMGGRPGCLGDAPAPVDLNLSSDASSAVGVGSVSVPEPGVLGLVGVAAGLLGRRRRR